MSKFNHLPVMKEEVLKGLDIKPGGIYFDGTLGGGGHSLEILKRSSPNGKLIATDLDDEAIEFATERLSEFSGRFSVYKNNFKNFEEVFEEAKIDKLDGVLLDFGVSSYQLDNGERGFSYLALDAKLDMRMDRKNKFTAYDVVNGYSEEKLTKIFYEYGEENFSKRIARNIVEERKKAPIERCGELVDVIVKSIPKKFQQGGHPAKRVFQAIRIEVNGELEGLYETVIGITKRLKKGGRIAILTFHSLEDRIVKNAFKELETDCICDKSLPVCVCGKKREIKIITRHPITAGEEELSINSRAKSAKLRIAEKI